MTLWTVALAVLLPTQLDLPPGPSPRSPCLGEPLELSLADMLAPGAAAERLTRERCLAERRLGMPMAGVRGWRLPLGRVEIGRFRIAGEPVRFGLLLSLETSPSPYHDLAGPIGVRPLDELHVTPELRLPEPWQWALSDYVYTPVLLGASATVGAAVLWSLVR